jgi:tetratricopeptide (TPR) repeat protein
MREALRQLPVAAIAAAMISGCLTCLGASPGAAQGKDPFLVRLVPAVPGENHSVSFTTLAAPEEAVKLYQAAYRSWRKGAKHHREAEAQLLRAIGIHSRFADAWHFLGAVRLALNEAEGAREAFLSALAADSRFLHSCVPLAILDLRLGRFDEAAQAAERALKLNPALAEARYFRAAAYYLMGDFGTAEQAARDVIARGGSREFPRVHVFLGDALARKGEIEAAVIEYSEYLRLEPRSPLAGNVRARLEEMRAAHRLKPMLLQSLTRGGTSD